MLKLFAAIDIPIKIQEQINLIKTSLSGAVWVLDNDYHITLSFIGNMDDIRSGVIEKIFAEIKFCQFNVKLGGIGCFKRNKEFKYLYAEVISNKQLDDLKDKIDRELQSYNIYIDKTEYKPHVTIAKLINYNENEISEFINTHRGFNTEDFKICNFSLYKSHENIGDGFYTNYKEYPLITGIEAK